MDGESQWRVWWRRGFGAFLLLALLTGLYLSYRPQGFSEAPEVAGDDQATEAPTDDEPTDDEPTDGAGDDPQETEQPTEPDDSDDDAMTEEEAEEFIAAARDPGDTTVQVLDAGGGGDATADAADVLRDLGYDVVAVNSSRTDYDVTTVLFTPGNRAEGQGLRAREQRVASIAENERLSDAVDLHVVVAADWTD